MDILSMATKAIAAQTRVIANSSDNVGKMNDTHHARKIVHLESAGEGMGVDCTKILDMRDSSQDSKIRQKINERSFYENTNSIHNTIEIALGENFKRIHDFNSLNTANGDINTSSGLSRSMDEFFNALNDLAANTNDMSQVEIAKQRVMNNGANFCLQFNRLDNDLSTISIDIDQLRKNVLQEVNSLIRNIKSIQDKITSYELKNEESALDMRNELVRQAEELAEKIDFSMGEELVDINDPLSRKYFYLRLNKPDGTYINVLPNSNVGTISYDEGTKMYNLDNEEISINGGSLASYNDLQNNTVDNLRKKIDSLAKQLITSMNQTYGDNFFDASNDCFGSAKIRLSSQLSAQNMVTGNPDVHSNNIVLAMSELDKHVFDTDSGDTINGTLKNYYRNTVVQLGTKFQATHQSLQNQKSIENNLKNQRAALLGVSLDQETTVMMVAMHAIRGASFLINTINEVLNIVSRGFKN